MATWHEREVRTHERLQTIQRDINNVAFALYGIDGSDRLLLEESLQVHSDFEPSVAPEREAAEDDTQLFEPGNLAPHVSGLLSYCCGGVFGR